MKNEKFSADMTPEERHWKLIEMPDDEIDYWDIPPLTDEFWKNADLKRPEKKEEMLELSDEQIAELIEKGHLTEVKQDEQEISHFGC